MKKIFFLIAFLFSVSLPAQIKVWSQSTEADFSKGMFNRTVTVVNTDGEVQLIHPVTREGNPALDATTPRNVSYDDQGNYLKGWITSKKVYIQKFNSQGQQLSGAIEVSERTKTDGITVGVGLLNDGRFAVSWAENFDSTNGFSYTPRYVQFFTTANEKIGSNTRIFGLSNATHSIPRPIVDQINKRFFIIGTEGNSTIGFQSYGWFYTPEGTKLRDSIKIVPASITKNEYHIDGAFHNGKFALVWDGGDDNVGPDETYFTLADSNGNLLLSPVIANGSAPKGSSSLVVFDAAGNSCVTWNYVPGVYPGPPGQIYSQTFDFTGNKIGSSKRLTDLVSGDIYWKEMFSANGMFKLGYGVGFHDGQPEQQWASFWKVQNATSGNFISQIFDAGVQQTHYKTFSWNGVTPTGTSLKFQLRSSKTQDEIQSSQWSGPTSGLDYYTNALEENINSAISQKRFIQVKAFFRSETNGNTPVLNDFSITYSSSDSIAPAPISNITAHGEHHRNMIGWTKSPSTDVKSYRIYRAEGVKNFDLGTFVVIPSNTASYIDSSVSFDILYRYGVTAVDSTFNESVMIESGSFSPKVMKIFVSSSGTEAGDGSASHPFATIPKAIEYSYKGDTVYVLPGDYRGDIVMKEGISLIGAGASITRLIEPVGSTSFSTASHTVVKGFSFVLRGIWCYGSDVLVTENIFTGTGSDLGIGIWNNAVVVISKNIISNFFVGIQIRANRADIRNNIIQSGICIQVWGGNDNIVNNIFVLKAGLIGIQCTRGAVTLRNNCIAGFPPPGTYITSIQNTINISLQLLYNDRWGFNSASDIALSSTEISVDPMFVSKEKNNFHLKSGSPCINAGDPSSEYNDKDGSRNDIGAYGGPDPMPEDLSAAFSTELSVKGGTGFPGDTVAVNVLLSVAAGVQKIHMDITFDENIGTFIDASTASLTNAFTVSVEGIQKGKRSIHLNGPSEILSGGGPVAVVRFKTNPSITNTTRSAVELSGEIFDGGNNRIVLSSIASGLIVVQSTTQFAHKKYVDAAFTGISDGSIYHPYQTIQQGIDSAKANDTVCVASGTYQGPISMKSDVYVQGAGASITTIIRPNDPLISIPTTVRFINVKNSGISGCTLINEASIGTVIEVMSSNAEIALNKIDQAAMAMYSVIVSSGSHVTIRDNYFIESKYGGTSMISVSANDAIITRNVFAPSSAIDAVVLNSANHATVTNNRFFLSKEMMTAITGMTSKQSLISNNLFSGTAVAGNGIKLFNADSTVVVNNIFDVRKTGISDNGGNQSILNNVFLNSTVGISVSQSAAHRYNLFWKNTTNVANGNLDTTELTADPQFTDMQRGNFFPAPLSILPNAGDPVLQWNDRDGTRNDIGIYGGPKADTMMFVAANMRLRIGSVSGAPGDTVKIPVIASGVIGMSGLQLMIEYDAGRIQLLNIHTQKATHSFSMVRKNIGQSIVSIELIGSEPSVIDSAAVVELIMRVLPNATGSAFVNFQNVYVVSGAAQPISVQNTENGIINLSPASVSRATSTAPALFVLEQNYPNPFNPSTTIRFTIHASGFTTLKVYDVLGKEVATLVNEYLESGVYHQRTFNAAKLASGIYFAHLKSGGDIRLKKMILIK
ncbi:MAG: cohesin domain-containing protein [Bacteroidota bacterium]